MARRLRVFPDESVLHVINRGNERRPIFADASGYEQFLWILDRTQRRVPLDLHGYVLMPNHWHLVVKATTVRRLSQFMHLLTGMHAVVLRTQSQSTGLGHIYQDRYRAWLVDNDVRYVRTIRYVEANPVRAGLIARAEDWAWSSLHERVSGVRRLTDGPVRLPEAGAWTDLVNRAGQDPDAASWATRP